MKKLFLIASILISAPALAQEQPALSPLQQYLYSESGYAPSVQQPVAVPMQQTYTPEQYAYVDDYADSGSDSGEAFFAENN